MVAAVFFVHGSPGVRRPERAETSESPPSPARPRGAVPACARPATGDDFGPQVSHPVLLTKAEGDQIGAESPRIRPPEGLQRSARSPVAVFLRSLGKGPKTAFLAPGLTGPKKITLSNLH